MLSQETLDEYRRMTPSERLRLTFAAIRENTPYLFFGGSDVVDRKFMVLQRENDARSRNILAGLDRLPRRAPLGDDDRSHHRHS